MATEKENKEYKTALDKIKELQVQLEKTNTSSREKNLEDRIGRQLDRLEALNKPEPKKEEEEEEEENQCPSCGAILDSLGDGVYECSGCGEYFEDE